MEIRVVLARPLDKRSSLVDTRLDPSPYIQEKSHIIVRA
jgi:hypothetical protein